MSAKTKKSLFVVLVIAIFIFFGNGPAQAETLHRIFILHSYERNHVCGQPQHNGVILALKNAGYIPGKNIVVQVYYMDTKQKNNTPELIEKQAEIALHKINTFKPEVLVTLDDNAFKYVALKLVDSNISIVFSGMNGQPEDYNKIKRFMLSRKKPGHNITGVYEKIHVADALNVHAKMFPGLQKVMIFTDLSTTGKALYCQIKIELGKESVQVEWEIKIVKTWNEYKENILSANHDPKVGAIYPVALLLKDNKGKTYTAPQIFKWTTKHSKKPEIAVNYAFTKLGLFGGAAVDFHAMGEQAGKMVVKIFKKMHPGNISISEANRYALAFNLKRAQQLGIKIPDDILMAADEIIK